MRVIKFRVWDKENKWMDDIDGYNLYLADNEIYEVEENTQGYETYMEKTNATDKYELMQYIGLTDILNKEIYEYDKVKVFDSYAPEGSGISNFIGIVKYGCGSFYISDLDGTYSTYRLMDLELEVIGNIFEEEV